MYRADYCLKYFKLVNKCKHIMLKKTLTLSQFLFVISLGNTLFKIQRFVSSCMNKL